MKYRVGVLLAVLALSLGLFFGRISLIERIALRVEDTKFYVREFLGRTPKPSDRVIVVAIDEKSVNELGRWPWNRGVMAELIRRLKEAKVVALDIVFSERAGEEDRVLTKAIEENGNVILGFFFRLTSTQSVENETLRLLEESEFLRFKLKGRTVGLLDMPFVESNIPELMSVSLSSGFLNAEPDTDAMYRKYTIAHIFRGGVYLPLALQALRFYEGKDFYMELSEKGIDRFTFRGENIPVYEGRFHRINFYRIEDLKVVPAVDVIKGRLKEAAFKDKAVFIGATEIGIYDVRPTPVDPITPGVFLHAMVFSNFLLDHFIYTHTFSNVLAILTMSFLPFLISGLREFKKRILFYVLSVILYPSLSYALFSYLSYDLDLFYPLTTLLLSLISQEGVKVFVTERSVRELRRAFSSYVSSQLLEIISRNPEKLKLGGERRVVTVMFSDIRGFTSLSERLKPEELVNLLNEFLTPMTDIILKNGGMLDKYIGDAIMAVFNAPVDLEDHADRACRSALEMLSSLRDLNVRFRRELGFELEIGIGINTGEAVVGNMGSRQRFDYTAIGDTVNLASRLEGLNKVYQTKIIISEHTRRELRGNFLLRKLDRVIVKGKREPVTIYELLDDGEINRRMVKAFERALEEYFKGNFKTASLLFEEVSIRFGDRTSFIFQERCREMMENPPREWNGIYIVREK